MNKKIFITMTIAAALLTACNNNDEPANNGPVEIRLTSAVSTQTRATSINNNQFENEQKVYVYVEDAEATDPYLYENIELEANGGGGFINKGTTMYFPSNGNNVNIYAVYPTLGEHFPETMITHTVATDQTSASDYSSSDLLYANKPGVAKTEDKIPLTFYHLLSKVHVNLRAGTGMPNLTDATISIKNTKTTANFTPNKTDNLTEPTVRAAMIVPGDDASIAPITIGGNNSDAIIVPQPLTAGTEFIKVHLTAGGDFFYKLPTGITFESGKVYTYDITVNLTTTGTTDLGVTSTINDWDEAEPVSGNAEIHDYYLIGTLDEDNWDVNTSKLIPFNHETVDEFVLFVESPGNYYWKVVPRAAVTAGEVLGGALGSSTSGKLETGAPAIKIIDSGRARIILNINTMTYTVNMLGNLYLYVPGTYQGWKTTTAPILYSQNSDKIYDGYVYMTAGTFKFIMQDDTDTWYGFDDGKLSIPGNDLTISDAGFYRLYVNLSDDSNRYSIVTNITKWTLFTGKDPEGFVDVPLTLNTTTGEWTSEIPANLIAGGKYVFHANDGWDIRLGGNVNNLTYGGDDKYILVPNSDLEYSPGSGTYNITLNLNDPKAYKATFVKQ